jgi:hypothetical protein
MALPHIEMPSFGLIPVMPSSYPRALPHRKMLQIFFFLLWPRSLHVWLWEKERKFTEEEQEEELLKISCKTKWSLSNCSTIHIEL